MSRNDFVPILQFYSKFNSNTIQNFPFCSSLGYSLVVALEGFYTGGNILVCLSSFRILVPAVSRAAMSSSHWSLVRSVV